MGIDISGGMILGYREDDLSIVDKGVLSEIEEEFGMDYEDIDTYEVVEYLGMESFSEHYDADSNYRFVGYTLPDVEITGSNFEDWVSVVKVKASDLLKLTGKAPTLVGMQDVY